MELIVKLNEEKLLKLISKKLGLSDNICIYKEPTITTIVIDKDGTKTEFWNHQLFRCKGFAVCKGYELDFSVKGNPAKVYPFIIRPKDY